MRYIDGWIDIYNKYPFHIYLFIYLFIYIKGCTYRFTLKPYYLSNSVKAKCSFVFKFVKFFCDTQWDFLF